MDKIINYQVTISPKTRDSQTVLYEFYSHDKNNSKLTFTMAESLADTTVTALFYFNRSKAKWETTGTVEGNVVTVKFDTTLITQDENVTGYLYFKIISQEADVFQFRFAVKVSKIDRAILANKTHRNEVPINISDFATKVELEQLRQQIGNGGYDDRAILQRLTEFENKEVTPCDDSALIKRVEVLENKPPVDLSHLATKVEEEKIKGRVEKLEQAELRGRGMPNEKITASVGTIYIDLDKTNGAVQWLKVSGDGNTGWEILSGDTGWRVLQTPVSLGNAKIRIRRANNIVFLGAGGLGWDLYGVKSIKDLVDTSIFERTINGEKYTWIRMLNEQGNMNNFIPVGFRSESSLLTGLYGDAGDLVGSIYIGGVGGNSVLQLRFKGGKEIQTDGKIQQLRFGVITYQTKDSYPAVLP